MTLEIFNQILESFIVIKIALLVLMAFHVVFLFIVFRQVGLMNKAITQGTASAILATISIVTLIASISLFLVTVVIL